MDTQAAGRPPASRREASTSEAVTRYSVSPATKAACGNPPANEGPWVQAVPEGQTVRTVTGLLCTGADDPAAFRAETANVYVCPSRRPTMVAERPVCWTDANRRSGPKSIA